MPVSLTVYDGANTIGGNKILLEDGATAVFLDFGTSFSTRFQYFEEFLVPRSRAGLLDLIHMGLLPPLRGIYTGDLRRHGGRRAFTEEFVKETAALKPVALLCEGTNIGKEPGVTEEQVYAFPRLRPHQREGNSGN